MDEKIKKYRYFKIRQINKNFYSLTKFTQALFISPGKSRELF